ncbi:MAG: hypothetical protein WC780_10665 [Lentimicrobiaceae bacterium]|jgi:hypothetical protein
MEKSILKHAGRSFLTSATLTSRNTSAENAENAHDNVIKTNNMFGAKKIIQGFNYFIAVVIFLGMIACSKDNGGGNSKISGSVSDNGGNLKSYGDGQSVKSSEAGIEGATVIIAEVQANGSLNTVSTQSVQTDINGKFTVETTLSGAKNLVVVASKGAMEWKTVVSAEVKSGTTVYAQPLNTESTAEAEVYARLKASGKLNTVSQADMQLYINSEVAAQIKGNASMQDQFISALEAKQQAHAQASSNAYFGITNTQMQAITDAKVQAQVAFEAALYNAGDSQSSAEDQFNTYQSAIISAYTNANVKAETYAKLSEISSKVFVNATASMSSQTYFACAKSNYLRIAFITKQAIDAKFQETGASSSQVSAIASAGVTLSASIKNSVSISQIINAFAQYHSAVVAQLKLTFSAQATNIDIIEASLSSVGGAATVLRASVGVSASTDVIINAYLSFFNSTKTLIQNSLTGVSATQVNAAVEILVMSNMN